MSMNLAACLTRLRTSASVIGLSLSERDLIVEVVAEILGIIVLDRRRSGFGLAVRHQVDRSVDQLLNLELRPEIGAVSSLHFLPVGHFDHRELAVFALAF